MMVNFDVRKEDENKKKDEKPVNGSGFTQDIDIELHVLRTDKILIHPMK